MLFLWNVVVDGFSVRLWWVLSCVLGRLMDGLLNLSNVLNREILRRSLVLEPAWRDDLDQVRVLVAYFSWASHLRSNDYVLLLIGGV